MNALRQEALQIVNDMPDDSLPALMQYLKKVKFGNEGAVSDEEYFAKRAKAIARIKEWQERNKAILKSGIDWDKAYEEAMEEKYGPFI